MNEDTVNEPGDRILRGLRWLTVAVVVTFVAIVVLGTYGWVTLERHRVELTRVTTDVNHALCTLRADLERRVTDGRQFLADHPDGIPGISVEEIQRGIDGQERTVLALSSLTCVSEEVNP